MSYKIGLVSVSFRSHSPTQILAAMNDAGLSFIEWGSDVHCPKEKAEEIAALQTRYGITCCSYGTYFRLGISSMEELPAYIAAAKILGTDILRLWCGNKNSEEYTEAEKEHLFRKCREAAVLAERNGVILCVECHNKTYTNKKEAALELMQAVDSVAFRMYWQPNQHRSEEENIAYAKLLAPYTIHIHVFNWKGKEKYPLGEAKGIWREYLSCFAEERTLLLEFMPDGKIESLETEAEALREIII